MWRLAWPIAATQLASMAMGFVDMVMVGPLGKVSLGAVSIGNAVYLIPGIGLAGVVMALDAVVGHLVGAGRRAETGRALWQGYWISLALAVPAVALLWHPAGLIGLLGQAPEIASQTASYLHGRAPALLPWLLYTAQRGFLSGVGNTRVILWIALAGTLLNVPLNLLLIHGGLGVPALGVEGVGWASTIAQTGMAALAFWVIHARHDTQEYGLRPVLFARAELAAVLRMGMPLGIHLSIEMASFSAVSVFAGWISAQALAAHQLAMTLAATTFMVPLGISAAASVRVAQRRGANDPAGVALAGRVALLFGVAFMLVSAIVFVTIPAALVSLFRPPPDVLALASELLFLAAAFQISDGLQVVSAGCLRGLGDTRSPARANLFLHWGVGIPLGWVLAFPFGLGVYGLWVGITTGLTLVGMVLTGLFLSRTRAASAAAHASPARAR